MLLISESKVATKAKSSSLRFSCLLRIPDWRLRAVHCQYNVTALAKLCGCSPRQLERFFAACVHEPPKRWLSRLRQMHAFELLRKGLPIKEVSFLLGYASVQHFTSDFTKTCGMTPGEFALATSASERSFIE